MSQEQPIIKFQNVDKFYGTFQALNDISIEVNQVREWLYVAHLVRVNLL